MISTKIKLQIFTVSTEECQATLKLRSLLVSNQRMPFTSLLVNWKDDGFLDKDENGKLIPRNVYGEVKILGLVEAGFPTEAEEEVLDTTSLDDYLIGNKEASFMLQVKGDSMIDAGIYDGDMVVAERATDARSGDIVIAEADGGWTMKYYKRKGNKVYLEPANKKYKIIEPSEELRISAVVKTVIRKYR